MTHPPDADRAGRRAQCPRCLRPVSTCLCGWIRPTVNEVEVLILQHPQEVHQAKGSARLLMLSLARCETMVGEQLDAGALASALSRPLANGTVAHPVLLYPGAAASSSHAPPSAFDASAAQISGLRLVVIDATWRKSLKMLHLHPALQALPRLALPADLPSRYAIRKAPKAGQLSTLEATCLALGKLEQQPARYAPLLEAFEGFVQAQQQWVGRARA
ncbi:MAG: tRNA-uridine aminocarboxypropyltransferase [Aquabacterium sp.]